MSQSSEPWGHNERVRSRWRWWLAVVVVVGVAWPVGAVVVGRHVWVAAHRSGPPLPRVTDLLPTVDRAIADVAAAIGDDAAIALAGLTPARPCSAGGRAGVVYTRNLDIYLSHGDEDWLVATIAGRLPAAYQAHREPAVAGAVGALSATPGRGVRLTVRQLGEGWLTAVAETDCRASRGGDSRESSTSPAPAVDQIVDAVMTDLHTHVSTWRQRHLTCPTGTLTTTVALSAPTDNDNLPAKLTDLVPATAHQYPSSQDRLAYRDGPTSVIVAATDEGGLVTVRYTAAC